MPRILSALALAAIFSLPAMAVSAEPLNVVASFSIIGDFAKKVGGDRINLTTLVGPGGDAHVYEPKPTDAVAMKEAQVVLVNGLHFEGFLQRLTETSGTTASIVELTKNVETIPAGHDHRNGETVDAHSAGSHDHGETDPHAFQSVANAKVYVKNIAEAFCTADPAGCDAYTKNAAIYDGELTALDKQIKDGVAALPADKRTIITSHDAFGYFAHAYGLTFLAPEGIATDAEASAADVAALVTQVREDKAAAIFIENITNPKLIEQIAVETGVKVGGTLYSDALSDGPPATTYVDLMRHNVATIKSAIEGM